MVYERVLQGVVKHLSIVAIILAKGCIGIRYLGCPTLLQLWFSFRNDGYQWTACSAQFMSSWNVIQYYLSHLQYLGNSEKVAHACIYVYSYSSWLTTVTQLCVGVCVSISWNIATGTTVVHSSLHAASLCWCNMWTMYFSTHQGIVPEVSWHPNVCQPMYCM